MPPHLPTEKHNRTMNRKGCRPRFTHLRQPFYTLKEWNFFAARIKMQGTRRFISVLAAVSDNRMKPFRKDIVSCLSLLHIGCSAAPLKPKKQTVPPSGSGAIWIRRPLCIRRERDQGRKTTRRPKHPRDYALPHCKQLYFSISK